MNPRLVLFLLAGAMLSPAQPAPPNPAPKLKDEMRQPWSRSNERFIRRWLALTDFPLEGASFEKDWLAEHGGESAIRPTLNMVHHRPDGKEVKWRDLTAWGDSADLSEGPGLKRELVGYAFTTVKRDQAGPARLSIGSDESIRVWVNGALVLDRRTPRQLTLDEDQVEVDWKAGDNALLIKLEQHRGSWDFSARVLEHGALPPRVQEIGPSLMSAAPTGLVVKTDINAEHAAQDAVRVEAVGAGGRSFASKSATRGENVTFDPSRWPDGAYEIRCSTRRMNGLLYVTHIPWYKGDSIAAARELVAAAGKADTRTPEGMTVKMLGDMIIDRLGKDYPGVTGNPWWAIHSPLLEYEELRLEAAGKGSRLRPYGFYRLAWRDEIDDSPQFCRAYLPTGYEKAKKWPLVVRLHGYNPANPEYVRWWSVDVRHLLADNEYDGHEGIVYVEPHGRGNNSYLGLGDQDVMRVIQLARERFNIDERRIYLIGESMGGWGTWNVGTRHPDLFAAIAPVYGGADYHSQMPEEQLAKLAPLDRFLLEKESSWSMAEGLLHVPVLVHHGDVDKSVNVDYSRYGVRMLERWGYNIRYIELPGYGHEELNVFPNIVNWFLPHRLVSDPARVRLRSAELKNAAIYWVKVEQAASAREFMVVDAEVAAPNTIRVDSQNVLALTLAPGALIDTAKPVRVVWNGENRDAKAEAGQIRLRAAGYSPAELEKNARTAGPLGDVFNTPFAIVAGTSSPDAAMKAMCAKKAEALTAFWKQWQNQPARFFKDSELTDADAARYSLILIGGPEANLVARKMVAKLPVEVLPGQVKIGGRSFPALDARVQAIYPNPLNAGRYVVLVAGTSADGLFFWSPEVLRESQFDFQIEDGHVAAGAERISPNALWVAGGWFDHRWQTRDDLTLAGNSEIRAKSPVLHAPRPDRAIASKVLDGYVGKYQLGPEMLLQVIRKDGNLIIDVPGQKQFDLLPVSDTEFFIIEGPVKIVFDKDGFKGWQGGQEFAAKKLP